MKVVINNCFGGFGLSPLATKRLTELNGKECYFFTQNIKSGLSSPYISISMEEAKEKFMWYAFSIPNPNEILTKTKDWCEMTDKERKEWNELYGKHEVRERDIPRDDPKLIQVVEKLGKKANGKCAELKIVEIPSDVEWEIKEYDGSEWVSEKHKTWS